LVVSWLPVISVCALRIWLCRAPTDASCVSIDSRCVSSDPRKLVGSPPVRSAVEMSSKTLNTDPAPLP